MLIESITVKSDVKVWGGIGGHEELQENRHCLYKSQCWLGVAGEGRGKGMKSLL